MNGAQLPVFEHGGQFLQHAEAEILQRGDRIGQRQRAFVFVDFQAQPLLARRCCSGTAGHRGRLLPSLASNQRAHALDIARGLGCAVMRAIGGGEGIGEAAGDGRGALGFHHVGQLVLHLRAPAAQHGLQAVFDRVFGEIQRALPQVEHEPQRGQIAAFDAQAPVEQRRAGILLPAWPGHCWRTCVDSMSRGSQTKANRWRCKRCLHQRQARAGPVDQAHHGGGDAGDVFFAEARHQIVRQRRQRMDQRLARVASGVEAEPVEQRIQRGAQARHVAAAARPARRWSRPRHGPISRQLRHRRVRRHDRHQQQVVAARGGGRWR